MRKPTFMENSYDDLRLNYWRHHLLWAQQHLQEARRRGHSAWYLHLHTQVFYNALDKVWEAQGNKNAA